MESANVRSQGTSKTLRWCGLSCRSSSALAECHWLATGPATCAAGECGVCHRQVRCKTVPNKALPNPKQNNTRKDAAQGFSSKKPCKLKNGHATGGMEGGSGLLLVGSNSSDLLGVTSPKRCTLLESLCSPGRLLEKQL
eukprot:1586227-Amphidinium_carterae.1